MQTNLWIWKHRYYPAWLDDVVVSLQELGAVSRLAGKQAGTISRSLNNEGHLSLAGTGCWRKDHENICQ
jgi:hypothetical protein